MCGMVLVVTAEGCEASSPCILAPALDCCKHREQNQDRVRMSHDVSWLDLAMSCDHMGLCGSRLLGSAGRCRPLLSRRRRMRRLRIYRGIAGTFRSGVATRDDQRFSVRISKHI